MRRVPIFATGWLLLSLAGHAFAGSNPNIQLALDMQAKSKTRSCESMSLTYTSCSVINQSVTLAAGYNTLDVIPVIYEFTGVTGVAFGLDWGSSSVLYAPQWTNCSDLQIPRVGTTDFSAAVTWATCLQPAVPIEGGRPLGWLRFTTYGVPGTIRVKPDDVGELVAVDCSFNADQMYAVHSGFLNGALPGPGETSPCGTPTPTEATTWSGVKSLYR